MLTYLFLEFSKWGLEKEKFAPNNLGCLVVAVAWADGAIIASVAYALVQTLCR